MCVSSALHPCINIKYRKPVRWRPARRPAGAGARAMGVRGPPPPVVEATRVETLRRRSPGAHETGGGTHVGSEATERSDAARCDGGAPEAARAERGAGGTGARRARGQGRRDAPPTELSVAGMLTHGHTSTVSSAGMTDHILIRAHRRPAHSRLSLSSSTHPPASEGQRRFVHSGQGGRHGISAFTKTESC